MEQIVCVWGRNSMDTANMRTGLDVPTVRFCSSLMDLKTSENSLSSKIQFIV